MKHFPVLLSVFFLLNFAAANDELPPNVLAEHSTRVGFAPPQMRGIYRLQILVDGTVQRVDNNGVATFFAELDPSLVANLSASIDAIKSNELIPPTSMPCMDAPGKYIRVRQSNGTSPLIWKNEVCREFRPRDLKASDVALVIKELEHAFSRMNLMK